MGTTLVVLATGSAAREVLDGVEHFTGVQVTHESSTSLAAKENHESHMKVHAHKNMRAYTSTHRCRAYTQKNNARHTLAQNGTRGSFDMREQHSAQMLVVIAEKGPYTRVY